MVVGAGAAGLAALAELHAHGARAICLEARDRIGGRILTIHDPQSPLPIELGAEFIHGRPPETWDIVRASNLGVYDVADASVQIKNGVIESQEDAWLPVERLMENMSKAAKQGSDESFASFLARSHHSESAKQLSSSFVEGFNAARKAVIGIASLAQDAAAAAQIDGDRSFRFLTGYDRIPQILAARAAPDAVRLDTIVSGIEWSAGHVVLHTTSAKSGASEAFVSSKAILTFPLGVLQAPLDAPGAIHWNPSPERTLAAARALAFGQVFRVVMRFRTAFWEEKESLADTGFFLSNENLFPTWWTPLHVRAPLLTGWSAGPHADQLLGKSYTDVVSEAVRSLARILKVPREQIEDQLEQSYFHDWHADPFAQGAYSYVPAGALASRTELAKPVEDTLYFSGEATELNGHSATVHGAIASGIRAARDAVGAKRRGACAPDPLY